MLVLYEGVMSYVDIILDSCGIHEGLQLAVLVTLAVQKLNISIEGSAEFLHPTAVLGSMEEGKTY